MRPGSWAGQHLKSSIQQWSLFYRGSYGVVEKSSFWLRLERHGKSPQWKVPLLNLTDCGCVGSWEAETDLPFGQETHTEYYITLDFCAHTHTHAFFSLKITPNCTTTHEQPRKREHMEKKRKIKSNIIEAVDIYVLTYILNMSATALTGSMWQQYDHRHHRKQPCRGSEWFCWGSNSMNIV